MNVFYYLRKYAKRHDGRDNIVCVCLDLDDRVGSEQTPEEILAYYRKVSPGREYYLLPNSCAKNIYGDDIPKPGEHIRGWNLPWPGSK